MSDLIEDPAPGGNAPEFSVSDISGAIKRLIEGEFSHVRVRGEIGRVSRPRSGHVYLDLKDDRNVLSAVIWKGVAGRLATPPEEGMEIIATGRLTTFGGQSKYQMVIEDIAPAGAGALMAMLEKRRKALAAEGLFDAARKRALPSLPHVIGVVTSPSGAVIRDILHRLRDRFPCHVLIWPVAVQGAKCARDVAAAIRGFNALPETGGSVPRPDVLIVARGGGSLEDLWGFNEEIVVRAAADSAIPLISAVGHETDTTLIDFAADRRAPTPTAAAEMAVPVRMELIATLDNQSARLGNAISRLTVERGRRLRDLSRALPRPDTLTAQAAQRLDIWGGRLPMALRAAAQAKRLRLSDAAAGLRPATLRAALRERAGAANRLAGRLAPGLGRIAAERGRALDKLSERLAPDLLARGARRGREAHERLAERLQRRATAQIGAWRDRLDGLDRVLQSLSYEETLRRGYAVVWDVGPGGAHVVTRQADAATRTMLEIQFHDGRLPMAPAQKAPAKGRPRGPGAPPEQGDLF
jgi:exodeoxyribonuclease VII large subunit